MSRIRRFAPSPLAAAIARLSPVRYSTARTHPAVAARMRMAGCLAALPALALAGAAHATTYFVTSGADTGGSCSDNVCTTLRAAVQAANAAPSSDIIRFSPWAFTDPNDAVVTLVGGPIAIAANSTLTIDGTRTDDGNVTISGNHASGVFLVEYAAQVILDKLDIVDGESSLGGGIDNGGDLTLRRSVVSGHHATGLGGGIYNRGTLQIEDSTLAYNRCVNDGGGIYNAGHLALVRSTVAHNDVQWGRGGGIYNNATLLIQDSTLSGNTSHSGGGGLYNKGGSTSVVRSLVSGNTAHDGGLGLYHGDGGGICQYRGALVIERSTVVGNHALREGGAIHATGNAGSFVEIRNSTLSGNQAVSNGGGIMKQGGMQLVLEQTTLARNAAGNRGGGVQAWGPFALTASVIADSPSGGDCWRGDEATINATFSLIADGLGCINGTNTGNLTGDARLAPLSNNGGPTPTHLPRAGSPLIDAVACDLVVDNATDQRGVGRPYGAQCDIGSVEVDGDILFKDGFEG